MLRTFCLRKTTLYYEHYAIFWHDKFLEVMIFQKSGMLEIFKNYPSKMSNIFNDFDVNVADDITKTIPLTPKSPLEYLSNRTGNSLFLTPVTLLEVNDLINILDPSKSVGPNSIPIKLL